MSKDSALNSETSLSDLSLLFLKLGSTAFGGPAAHIAMMKTEVVTRRKWMTETEFLDYLSATYFIPGPNSTEMAIHIGHRQRGFPGLIVAGASFILPAMLIVWALAYFYTRYGQLPQVAHIFYGIKPVIIAVVLQAIWTLGRSALKSKYLFVVASLALAAAAFKWNEILILFLAGILSIIFTQAPMKSSVRALTIPLALNATSVSLSKLFLTFLKIGSVLFGSGYVLLAFLQTEFVEHRHWLTQTQLIDAIAIGQFTPGPVFTTATFIGYLIAQDWGALLATFGIFAPSFIFVALTSPWIPRLRKSVLVSSFLDGVNVASLALMAAVIWQLGQSALIDPMSILIAVGSLLILLRFGINSAWLILAGAVLGYFR